MINDANISIIKADVILANAANINILQLSSTITTRNFNTISCDDKSIITNIVSILSSIIETLSKTKPIKTTNVINTTTEPENRFERERECKTESESKSEHKPEIYAEVLSSELKSKSSTSKVVSKPKPKKKKRKRRNQPNLSSAFERTPTPLVVPKAKVKIDKTPTGTYFDITKQQPHYITNI